MKNLLRIGLLGLVVLVVIFQESFSVRSAPSQFDKNTILYDHDFDFKNTLSAEEIQDLFEGKGQWKGKKGRSFFADYIDPVTNKSANQVIVEIAEKYQISSKVLLAKMQVETSSIWFYQDMNKHKYYKGNDMGTLADWVLMYGWTDKGPIPKYKGFHNQIDAAAKSLSEWFINPESKGWTVDQPHLVDEGRDVVIPTNRATVALYIYTPWIGEKDPATIRDDFGNKLLYNVWKMMFGDTGECEVITPPPIFGENPWPMFRHDAQNTGQSSYLGPENPALKWKIGKLQSSWIAIGKDETIYADLETGLLISGLSAVSSEGVLKWNSELRIDGGFAIAEDGTLYLTKVTGPAHTALFLLNGEGQVNWAKTMELKKPIISFPRSPFDLSPLISAPVIGRGGDIYVVTGFWDASRSEGWVKVYAFSREGYFIWKFPEVNTEFVFITPSVDENPAVAVGKDGTIYGISGRGLVYALDPEGKVKWEYQIEGEKIKFIDRFNPAPLVVVSKNNNIYFVAELESDEQPFTPREYLFSLKPNGSLNFKLRVDEWAANFSPPVIGLDDTIYLAGSCCAEGRKEGFEGKEGIILVAKPESEVKWIFGVEENIATPPSIDQKGAVYFADEKGTLYALNSDGTLKWKYETGQPPEAYLLRGAIAIGQNKTLYFAGYFSDGESAIYAIGEAE